MQDQETHNRISTLSLLSGRPLLVEELNLIINQPKMFEIAILGDSKLSLATSLLNVTKDTIDLEELDEETAAQVEDSDVFYMFMDDENNREAISLLFGIIFKEYESEFLDDNIIHLYKKLDKDKVFSLYIGNKELIILREYINEIFLISLKGVEEDDDYNPGSEAAQRIADKMRAGRKKAAEIKAKQKGKKTKDGIANLVSALAVGLQLPLDSVMNYTMFQIYDQSARLGKYESSKIAIDLMKMGGDGKLVDWREDLDIRK